jgi:hypothetical protein
MFGKYGRRPKLSLETTGQDHKPSRWEGLAFTGAYVSAIAVATLVLVSSRSKLHSLGAWLVFIVFVACLTAIFLLFRKARARGDWHWRSSGRDTSLFNG